MSHAERYHVLLIGCNQYPPSQPSLRGCVNDIDAIERLLLDEPGIGTPASQIQITRLADPLTNDTSTSRFISETRVPTKANIVAALRALGSEDVRRQDRVLIYYSGHGYQTQRRLSSGWFECLVPSDLNYLYDDELNGLIAAITRRTTDVTIILDCCHAAGATRAIFEKPSHGAVRAATPRDQPGEPPDPTLVAEGGGERTGGMHLLQATDPDYLVIAACLADEKAQEDALDDSTTHGLLTYGLLKILDSLRPEQRKALRWDDIWSRLLETMNKTAASRGLNSQNPWMIGRMERRVFGGLWSPKGSGFLISENGDGTYTIDAGTLVGITPGAILEVFGSSSSPSSDDLLDDQQVQVGRVKVIHATLATCIAEAIQSPIEHLPRRARARIVSLGISEGLRVGLDSVDDELKAILAESPLLECQEPSNLVPEVWLKQTAEGWEISNDMNSALAQLQLEIPSHPQPYQLALRDGLNAYAHYNLVLRLPKRYNDPELNQAIGVILHDCSDSEQVRQVDPKQPTLPELPCNADRIYDVASATPYCVRLTNLHWQTLYFTVFNCTALGKVEFLGDVSIRPRDVETLWAKVEHRKPFKAVPDNPNIDTIDRLIVLATTVKNVSLRGLEIRQSVQAVIDKAKAFYLSPERTPKGSDVEDEYPREQWTAVTVPLKIQKALSR